MATLSISLTYQYQYPFICIFCPQLYDGEDDLYVYKADNYGILTVEEDGKTVGTLWKCGYRVLRHCKKQSGSILEFCPFQTLSLYLYYLSNYNFDVSLTELGMCL